MNAPLYVTVAIQVFVCGTVIVLLYRYFIRPRLRSRGSQGSVLLSDAVSDKVIGASAVTPQGHRVMFTANLSPTTSTIGSGLVYCVDLPYVSGVHLVGLPVGEATPQLGDAFERVELEGDYGNYFTLYADTDQEWMTQYVLDPSAMAFTVDFCRQYNWEIQGDDLYFSSATQLPSFAVVDQFIEEIRPAIATASTRRDNPYELSYGDARGYTMKCPRCQQLLVTKDDMLECLEHGYLVTGGQLLQLRKSATSRSLRPLDTTLPLNTDDATVTCPYCAHDMPPSRFAMTNVIINICTGCMYRWVDRDEAEVVLGDSLRK